MDRSELVGELLTLLERAEVRLMAWGFADVTHTGEEVVTLFSGDERLGHAFQEAAGPGGEELWVDDLVAAGLLYRVSFGPPASYRSRFAESTRLFLRLRQRFRNDDWSTAPELVSDARFYLGPRHFPVRNIRPPEAWRDLAETAWSPALQRSVFDTLCHSLPGLAAFQVRATRRILEHYRGIRRLAGTVITAGTGSGKTRAFYLPALMGIAADVAEDPACTTRVLSVYPRNVLLADQFAEAIRLAVATTNALGRRLGRPLRVGALIGEVPFSADFEGDGRNKFQLPSWKRPTGVAGHLVPHLRDPETGTPLLWLDSDRRAGRTTLRLASAPERVGVPDGVVVLTREDIVNRPPDILLTSIEMLNKDLSSEFGRRVLGFGSGNSSLKLVLLDEIHTYEGLTGAQVPWILRRMLFWTRGQRRTSTLHVVGLSATLEDASNHLATLCGAPEEAIVEVAPDNSAGELTTEGQEYNVVLKAHPGSGAGVLATSIQTVMLGARVLTPRTYSTRPGSIDGAHFFGRKVFGFTDNLDVVNRWLPDFLDAEQTKGLARLRAAQAGDDLRWQAGQAWRISEQLKHNLALPVRATRTSSQDPGVDGDADVVLATSALEVGFDDDEVGMVVQHKAPRSAASFLQRKGRAGRRKGMRPWAVVVLSEHGRDRWAFRDSERLFSPSLERLALPAFNPYVLRIQATWFLVDWIANRVGRGVPSLYLTRTEHLDQRAVQVVQNLIDQADLRAQLTRDLADWIRFAPGGLRAGDAERLAQDLLWMPPRAVLRHVLPSLWNQMEEAAAGGTTGRRRLLPQFLPERTWEVLDTQDVELTMPRGDSHFMDVKRALRECVPGRVSRRFSVGRHEPSKWLSWSAALLQSSAPTTARVDQLFVEFAPIEDVPGVTIFQPTVLALGDVPEPVKKSSNAEWAWTLEIQANGDPGPTALHAGSLARSIFATGQVWLHRDQAMLRVYRYSSSVRYELLVQQDTRRGTVDVEHPTGVTAHRRPAIGFVRSVDGLRLDVRPDLLDAVPSLSEDLLASLRPAYLRHMAMQSTVLRGLTSSFGVGLLVTSAIGMLAATALRKSVSLSAAWSLLADKPSAARKVLGSVLAGEVDDDATGLGAPGRRVQEVMALWADPVVAGEMEGLVGCLWQPPSDSWRHWLRTVVLETLRAAVEAAVHSVLPEVPDGDFVVEVAESAGGASVWILESEAGGIGVIDRLLAETDADPSLFDTALEASLTTCPAERIITNVEHAVNVALRRDSGVSSAFADVRDARSYHDLLAARDSLVSTLTENGCAVDREAIAALVGKALMPGSSPVTDRWLRRLTRGRRSAIGRLGLALDTRVWAYWTTTSLKRRALLMRTLRAMEGGVPTDSQVTSAAARLTLDPCRDSCPDCLGTSGELVGVSPSRRLAQQWLNLGHVDHLIEAREEGSWLPMLDDALATRSRFRIRCTEASRSSVGKALAERLAIRHDRGYVLAGFRVASVHRVGTRWEVLVRIDDLETI